MISVKQKTRINRSAPHPTSKPLDSKFNFIFSTDIRDWMYSKALRDAKEYQKAKPVF